MTRVLFLAYVKETFKRTDKDVEIYRAYNETIYDIAGRYAFEGYNFQSYIPTVDGQEDYPLPTNLLHVIHPARCLEGNATNDDGWNLHYLTKEEYDAIEPNPNRTSPDTGTPTGYTIFSDSLLLTPIPDDEAYLIEINWGKVATALSADGDTPGFLSNQWDEILKWGTLWRTYTAIGLDGEGKKWHDLYESEEKGVPKMIQLERDKKQQNIEQIEANTL